MGIRSTLIRQVAKRAKTTIDERGGTGRLRSDAKRLKGIATGAGSPRDKARRAGDVLREPAPQDRDRPAGEPTPRPEDRP